MLGAAWKSLVVVAGMIVAADIAGVIFLTICDILMPRFFSVALGYVVWVVFGILCGMFAYNAAGEWALGKGQDDKSDWSSLPAAKSTGLVIVVVAALLIAGLCAFFNDIYWSQGVAGEYYVPDSMVHSLLFSASVLGAMLFSWLKLTPST